MKLFNKSSKNISKDIKKTFELFNNSEEIDDKLLLITQLVNLYSIFNDMKFFKNLDHYMFFIEKRYYQMLKDQNKKSFDEFLDSFISNKTFHYNLILNTIELYQKQVLWMYNYVTKNEDKISINDIYEILFEFMKTLKLDDLFDKLVQEKDISLVKKICNEKSTYGTIIYNPINESTNIVLRKRKDNTDLMFSLVHEIGHLYDLKNMKKDSLNFIKYSNQSIYLESMSKTFRRLLYRYLLKNNIITNSTTNNMVGFYMDNEAWLARLLFFTLLNKDELKQIDKIKINLNQLSERTKDSKLNFEYIKHMLKYTRSIDLVGSAMYGYGGILSLYLADEIENNGIDGNFIQDFFEERYKCFDNNFFEKNDINTTSFIKKTNNELKLVMEVQNEK